jgi:ribosome-binding factor A
MSQQRRERIAESMRGEISRIFLLGMHDPRVGFVTVTGVDLSPDLRHARVYVSVLGDAPTQEETLRALVGARGWVRRELAHSLTLRRVPDLSFRLDTTGEQGERIERLIRETRPAGEPDAARESPPPGSAGPEDEEPPR